MLPKLSLPDRRCAARMITAISIFGLFGVYFGIAVSEGYFHLMSRRPLVSAFVRGESISEQPSEGPSRHFTLPREVLSGAQAIDNQVRQNQISYEQAYDQLKQLLKR